MKLIELTESSLYKFHTIDRDGVKVFVSNSANLEQSIPTMKKHVERTGKTVEVSLNGKVVGKITKMGFQKLDESVDTTALPTKFETGNAFMSFVYRKWPSKETHVEHQGRGHWSAEIEGDGKIKAANYNESNKFVSWLDGDYNEI